MTMAIGSDEAAADNNNKRPLEATEAKAGVMTELMPARDMSWKWEPPAPVSVSNPNVSPTSLPPIGGCSQPSYTDLVKSEQAECHLCGEIITDRYIFQVASRTWHSHCLRCTICDVLLDTHTSCFLRDNQLFCKIDYLKTFGAKCFKCCRVISGADWVRKARDQVYHLACFACDNCKRQLSTGEEFGIHENRVLCKAHYMETLDAESGESDSHNKKKTKRMRTTFTEEQIQVLQANFQLDSNPDGQDLERIAQITGLSKRVTQVWFQNCRARQKKYINSGKSRGQKSKSAVPLANCSPVPRDQQPPPPSQQQQQLDLHVMYSTFRAQPSAPGSVGDGNPDDLSQASTSSGFIRSDV